MNECSIYKNKIRITKRQRIYGINILILCWFALIKVSDANEISNPQFHTNNCDIDPETHTCIVTEVMVRPWHTTQRESKIELSTLADIHLLFDHQMSLQQQDSKHFCILRQSRPERIYQAINLIPGGVYSLTFDFIGGDTQRRTFWSFLSVSLLTGERETTEKVSLQLGIGLRTMTVYFTIYHFDLAGSIFQFSLTDHRTQEGVIVAVSNWNLKSHPNIILNGRFEEPRLREGQEKREVRQDDVYRWKIVNMGYVARWTEPESCLKQGFVFHSYPSQKYKLSQSIQVDDHGLLRIFFLFKYESLDPARATLQVGLGSRKFPKIILDQQEGKYVPMTAYPYFLDVKCSRGEETFFISAAALSTYQMSVYVSDVRIAFLASQEGSDEAGPSEVAGASASGYSPQSPQGASLQSGIPHQSGFPPRTPSPNLLQNGDFSQPPIPEGQTELRVMGDRVPFWQIRGVGWLQKRDCLGLHCNQGFLFRVRLFQTVQLQQPFKSQRRMKVKVSFSLILNAAPTYKSALSIHLNRREILSISLASLKRGQIRLYTQSCFCYSGENSLRFQASSQSIRTAQVLIFDVLVQQQEDPDAERGAARGAP